MKKLTHIKVPPRVFEGVSAVALPGFSDGGHSIHLGVWGGALSLSDQPAGNPALFTLHNNLHISILICRQFTKSKMQRNISWESLA